LDSDLNKYDLEHVCTTHPRMSEQEWMRAYHDAWKRYYSPQHAETILRRSFASGLSMSKLTNAIMVFSGSLAIEDVHPLQLGIVRRKVRTQRRHGMPLESPLIFYSRRVAELVSAGLRWGMLAIRLRRMRKRIETDPAARSYTDESLQPVHAAELDHFVEVFADKIPKTHGAPKRRTAATA
jgi:hypothetical protein